MRTVFICSNCKTVQTDDEQAIKDPLELSTMLYAKAFMPNQMNVIKVSRCQHCKDKPAFEKGGW